MAKVADLIVRVELRGKLAIYRWDGWLPLDNDVTPSYKPPLGFGVATKPSETDICTQLLATGLAQVAQVDTFQFDCKELTVRPKRNACLNKLNKAVEKLLGNLPPVKKVRMVGAMPTFSYEEAGTKRKYAPPAGSRLVKIDKVTAELESIEGLVVREVRTQFVTVEPDRGIGRTWNELHEDVMSVLRKYCH